MPEAAVLEDNVSEVAVPEDDMPEAAVLEDNIAEAVGGTEVGVDKQKADGA